MNQLRYISYVSFNWFVIFLCLVASKSHVFFWPIAFLIISNRQFANYLAGHDGIHGLIFKNAALNDFFTRLFCLGPVFVSLQSYKEKHGLHHELLGTFADPDKRLYDFYPLERNKFFPTMLKNTLSLLMLKDFLIYFTPLFELNKKNFYRFEKILDFIFYVLISSCFTILFIVFFGIKTFIVLWILPLLLLMPYYYFVSALQHGGIYAKVDSEASRNIHGPIWLMEILLPCATNYHGVHHDYPNVSFYNLRKIFQVKKLPSISYAQAIKELLL